MTTKAPLWRGQRWGRAVGDGGHGEVTLTCSALNFRRDIYSCSICVIETNGLKFNFIEKILEI